MTIKKLEWKRIFKFQRNAKVIVDTANNPTWINKWLHLNKNNIARWRVWSHCECWIRKYFSSFCYGNGKCHLRITYPSCHRRWLLLAIGVAKFPTELIWSFPFSIANVLWLCIQLVSIFIYFEFILVDIHKRRGSSDAQAVFINKF